MPQLDAACCSARGPRAHQEDRCLVRADAGLFAVADGMGGWLRGDEAAAAVVEALAAIPPQPLEQAVRAVETALAAVNARLQHRAALEGPSGTTVVVLLIDGVRLRILWAGDSRAGRVRAGRLTWLTTDHNLAAQAVQAGRMDDETARRTPLASRLTRAVGTAPVLELERIGGRLAPGDRLLLCSDGLTGALDDEEILALLTAPGTAAELAERLVTRAVADPRCSDNVTALVVRAAD